MTLTQLKSHVSGFLPENLKDCVATCYTQFGTHILIKKGDVKSNIVINGNGEVIALSDGFDIVSTVRNCLGGNNV